MRRSWRRCFGARAPARVRISSSRLFDTIADLMNVPYLTRRYGGREPRRLGLAHPSIAPYGVFHFADGDIVIAVQSEGEWKILCAEVLGDEALAARSALRHQCEARAQPRSTRRPVAVEIGREDDGRGDGAPRPGAHRLWHGSRPYPTLSAIRAPAWCRSRRQKARRAFGAAGDRRWQARQARPRAATWRA